VQRALVTDLVQAPAHQHRRQQHAEGGRRTEHDGDELEDGDNLNAGHAPVSITGAGVTIR
jgi:hypothetical protein